MYDALRLIKAGLAIAFLDDDATRSIAYFRKEDLNAILDDPISLPEGKP